MRQSTTCQIAALGALGCAVMVPAVPAHALSYGLSPAEICGAEKFSNEVVEKHTALLGPPNEGTVLTGTTVTLSGEGGYESPLTFAVASSLALLSHPDIDGGSGSLQPGTSSYTFTSTKAAVTPRTIYWAASFTRVLRDCEGPPVTYTTPVRTLTVLPAPTTLTPPVAPRPLPLHVSIGKPGSFRMGDPSVAYRIHCTASCSGDTSSQAWLMRRHRKAVRLPVLDFGPVAVSITGVSGGDKRFTYVYSGSALGRLKNVLHEGDEVELRLSVTVSGASGKIAQAHRTAWLHR